MNVKIFLFMIVVLCAVNSAFALKITIYNASDYMIEVDPIWRGNPRGFSSIPSNLSGNFNSSLHHLQGIYVNVKDNLNNILQCFFYNVDRYNLKGTGQIMITLGQPITGGFNQAIVSGQTMAGIKSTRIDTPFGVFGEDLQCR